jgi:KAP family P-loop domain
LARANDQYGVVLYRGEIYGEPPRLKYTTLTQMAGGKTIDMKNNKTQTSVQKTWSSAWEEASDFDRRCIWLSVFLLLAGACTFTLAAGKQQMSTLPEALLAAVLLFVFLSIFYLAYIFKHRFSEVIAGFAVIAVAGVVAFASALVFVGAFAVAGAVAGAFAGFFAGAFAGAGAFVSAFAFAVAGLSIFAFAAAGVSAGAGAITFAGAGGAVIGALVIVQFHWHAFLLFQRAQEIKEKETKRRHDYQETTTTRRACRAILARLQGQKRSLTLGLAGRRGLGKTALLRYALQENASLSPTQIKFDRDLNESAKVRAERLRRLTLFVATPTEFTEQVFLMALMERLAQAFNQALIRLLPSVKPFKIEQELREKRRLLRVSHMVMLGLIMLNIGMSFYYLNAIKRVPVLRQLFLKPDSTITYTFSPPRIYTMLRDSLLTQLHTQAALLQDSLAQIDALLNPIVFPNSWNKKGKLGGFTNEFLIQATWDSLKKSKAWPKLDSLRSTSQRFQTILDSIKAVSLRYQTLSDSVALLSEGSFTKETLLWQFSGWFWFNCVLLLALPFVYWGTREGESRFTRRVYSVVRNEIALYERTNALLERLHFQMSFGESREAGLVFSKSGWQLTRKISKQVQRQVRPYTTMSLIDEFRDYIADAKMYLNNALKMSNPETQERFQIIIAIDELDKILDTEKLHNMLKSMKAIFEIEDVYYILSISEDALETYRLRHVDTKNEIDSAFTHIIPVPPMDAIGSLAFYIEHHKNWQPHLLPAAIVFGGGVPRDMHRLSQLFGTYSNEISLEQCLQKLVDEDISACEDMILLNAHLSDEGKQVWLKILEQTGFTSAPKTKQLLKEIEKYTLEEFEQLNLCAGTMAKEQFHRLRSLVRGVVVKGFIYHTVQRNPTPATLASWPPKTELKNFMKHLPEEASLGNWLAHLEPLRDAIFELSRNPLRVWENLTKV